MKINLKGMMSDLKRTIIMVLLDLLAVGLGGVIAFILYVLWLHFVGY